MDNEKWDIEFDRFLQKEMTADEERSFQQQLDRDPEFRSAFMAHEKFVEEIASAAGYTDFRAKMNQIHEDLYGERKKLFILKPKFLIPLSLVAGLALLITVIIPMTTGGDSMAENKDGYAELENADDSVEETSASEEGEAYYSEEANYESDTANMAQINVFLDPVNKLPKGTAFLLDRHGLFLTSGHLVRNREEVKVQNKDLNYTFSAQVVYRDSIMDFAILKTDHDIFDFVEKVPFKFCSGKAELGEEVLTLGYPKKEIVYTKGDVSSENGFKSDSLYMEVSMPANPGYSGAPLFNQDGRLCGIITANNSKKQNVTYVLKHQYIEEVIDHLTESDSISFDLRTNYAKKFRNKKEMISVYREFIYEVH